MNDESRKNPIVVWALTGLVLLLVGCCSYLLYANSIEKGEVERLRGELADLEDISPVTSVEVVTGGDEKLLAKLNEQLTASRREAAGLRQQLDEREQTAADQADRSRDRRSERGTGGGNADGGQRPSISSWMDRLKEEDPKRYEEIQTRIKEMQTRRTEGLEKQTDFIASIDVKRLDEEQLDSHNLLLAKLEIIKDLNERMMNPGEDDNPQELRGQIRQETDGIRELLDKERTIVFQQLAMDLGYDVQGANEFSEYIEQAYQNTSIRNVMGGFSRGRRRSSGGGRTP